MRRGLIFAFSLLLSATPCRGLADPFDQPPSRSLELRGTTRQVFRELEKAYERTITVDNAVRRKQLDFRLEQADFNSALKVATTLTEAFWVEQPDGSILIVPDNDQNRQLHMPQILESFPLPGYTDEEINEVVTLLREQVEPPYLSADLTTSTLTVRDTEQRLAVISALIDEWAPMRGEVVLDVLIAEISVDKARKMGILPPNLAVLVHIGAGVLPTDDPAAFLKALQDLVDRGVLPAILLSDQFDLTKGVGLIGVGGGKTEYVANLPGLALTLDDIYSVTKGLRRVRLRQSSRTEASFFSGEKFPIAITQFSTIFIPQFVQDLIDEGTFIPPVPAFQFEDLGLKLTTGAVVHHGREISLSVLLEATQLAGEGTQGIPIISNRRMEQQVRLKEGESVILSGIHGVERSPIRVGWPVLGAIPGLGRLFSRKDTRLRDTEFLVMITPRMVRNRRLDGRSQHTVYVGSEKEFAPVGRGGASRSGQGQRTLPTRPAPGSPRQPQPPRQQIPQQPSPVNQQPNQQP